MSRPRWSEPSQCSRPGGARLWAASVAIGSCVWSWSANAAVSTITSMIAPPVAPSGFFRQKRSRAAPTPARLARAGSAGASAWSSGLVAIAHPRVEHAVQHVNEQVRQDDDDRDEHDQVLDDRIVAPEDRLDEEAREP